MGGQGGALAVRIYHRHGKLTPEVVKITYISCGAAFIRADRLSLKIPTPGRERVHRRIVSGFF
jgi:hypothetical protein